MKFYFIISSFHNLRICTIKKSQARNFSGDRGRKFLWLALKYL